MVMVKVEIFLLLLLNTNASGSCEVMTVEALSKVGVLYVRVMLAAVATKVGGSFHGDTTSNMSSFQLAPCASDKDTCNLK
jgi:hypothetical protein